MQESRILVVLPSEGLLHTFVYCLRLTRHRQYPIEAGTVFEYGCPGMAPIWIALVTETQPLGPVLDFAYRNRLSIHNYTYRGILGPGGLQTAQQWMGSQGPTVRQRYGDEVALFLQRSLGTGVAPAIANITPPPAAAAVIDSEAAELERVLALSLETFEAGRRSPCPSWVEPLRSFKSEPAVPGIHPRCVSCLESRASLAFVDCGHQVVCDECAYSFWSRPGGPKRQCLVCRKPIQHAPVHLFPSEPLPVPPSEGSAMV